MSSFNKKIFLIGMPGSGKSTLGKLIASELNLRFYDLDLKIEENERKTISEIFKVHGEVYFREVESENLKSLIYTDIDQGAVISTGGGSPCFHDNMKLMNDTGLTVYLDVPNPVLITRLMATDLSSRPKFKNEEGLKLHLQQLYNKRNNIYDQAQVSILGEDIQVHDILPLITF